MPVKLISLPQSEIEQIKKAADKQKRTFSSFVRFLFAFWMVHRKENKTADAPKDFTDV